MKYRWTKWLCKIFPHAMYFDTCDVTGPTTCKWCGHHEDDNKVNWPNAPT